ncbi:MAG: glycoside hydrolase family 3 C-terminal domain-containing protein [Acidobacteria bacterium]|nr:glycoside hydrolase family 3 C-terminal domain-containing protein [Acidobacteriota bacterium]
MPVENRPFLFKSVLFSIICLLPSFLISQEIPPYRNSKLPVEQRINDLLLRMTLEEKVAQLTSAMDRMGSASDPKSSLVDEKGIFQPERAASLIKNGLGQISRPSGMSGPRRNAEHTNAIQKWVRENTRLGIPILFHEECLHGHAAQKGTSFPQAIALASTWDPEIVEDVFSATASEVRARGSQQCLTPVLDIVRDPRWGRTEETYGEDPYLAARIGVAAVKGFQGTGPFIDKSHVIATAKHFAVHGQPEGGANTAPGNYSERVMREYFLKPFESAVKEAGLQSIMASYNEIDGVPSHGNKYLLDNILRQEWGFNGVVVSDYFGIRQLRSKHFVAGSNEEAAKLALESGVDIELPYIEVNHLLLDQVKQGKVSEASIDRAVARILRSKFITGLFDDPFVDPDSAEKITNSDKHQQLALHAARKAIILLKNEGNLLPLKKTDYKRIAVIGPNAKEAHLGGYSGMPGRSVSILDGIKAKVGSGVDVEYAVGVRITETRGDSETMPTFEDKLKLGDPQLNAGRIKEAVSVAEKSDLIILALGGNEQTCREAWANHLGDRSGLDLLGNQDDLVKAMLALRKPIVVFLIHGRPNSINYIAENVPAILEGWYLGQESGTAVADVLFGDHNPGGKLPLSVPRSVGQLPVYYYQKPSARLDYVDSTASPLYPFGWGLSYTAFKYGSISLSPDTIGPEGKTRVSIEVTNTGAVRGDEVVQLYIRDEVSSIARPVKELRGFRRITLDPGKTQTVEFILGPEELSFLNRDMHRVVEPGTFKIMAGGNSVDLTETTLTVVAK